MAILLDGQKVADEIKKDLAVSVRRLKEQRNIIPKLAAVLIGSNAASQLYVKKKMKACSEIGMDSSVITLPETVSEAKVLREIEKLNGDAKIHSILVQLPLPMGLNTEKILTHVSPDKDVDGFHPLNVGKLVQGYATVESCTPRGIVWLLEHYKIPISGKHAVIVGRSNIVGKPMAFMLLARNATVTICHSRTENLKKIVNRGDIVVVAVGRARAMSGDYFKKGAVIVDVGINREEGKLVGDVDFKTAEPKASYMTPVPGGVGPMTVAMLLRNALQAAERASV